MVNVIFLDIDGVLNHQFSKDRDFSQSERFGIAQDLVDNLKLILDAVDNCKIAISSSWRKFRTDDYVSKTRNWRDVLCDMLKVPYDTVIGDIPTTHEFTERGAEARAQDIKGWLNSNKHLGVGSFAIIDDECSALKKAFPNNVVDCEISTYNGLTKSKAQDAIWILTNFGKDKKMTPNTWFISDTHFYHGNIIRYCNRPWSSGTDAEGQLIVNDSDVASMNDDMVKKWNSVVKPDDIVWHLGDFAFGKKENVAEVLKKLNGKVNLVMGNHDHHKVSFYQEAGFHRVYDRPVIINKFVILSHAPLEFLNKNCPFFNVFGHVHDSDMYKTFSKNSCCVCVERHNYAPVSWEKIQEEYLKLNPES